MKLEQLFETIFIRKSCRKYDMTPLDSNILEEVKEHAAQVQPLVQNVRYELSYLGTQDVKNILPIKAPHYICIYSEKKDNYLMNAGYVLQQIDLYLSANNMGSCWLGMAKPTKEIPRVKDGLEFVIMLAFGNATEKVHRESVKEFRRKSFSEISDIPALSESLEPVRLAPSASNTQTWFFTGTPDEIIVCREKLNIIKEPLYGRMNQIDIGIALCHLWLSYMHWSKHITFNFDTISVPKGYEYMVKVNVNK